MSFGFGRTTVASAEVVVTANTSGMTHGLKSAESSFSSFASKARTHTSSVVGALGKVAKYGALGAFGAGFLAFRSGFADLQQGAAAAAQTAAVLKSTGNAAHVSAGQVAQYAGAVQAKTGVDDAAVQSGENLLLTFTNIQNVAGKGNDIFNQTRQTMVDLSVAFGQDTKSSAIQLGKALQDPVKGMSALSRVGVTFTAGQQKTIKAMVASNNLLGAQKLMLKAVNLQVAGSANAYGKTLPGMIARAKGWLDNFTGAIIAKAIPALAKMIGWIDNFAHSKGFQEWLARAKEALRVFWGVIQGVLGFIQSHSTYFEALAVVFGVITGAIVLLTAATVAWGVATAIAGSEVFLVAGVIALLVVGLVYAYTHFKTFHKVVDVVFHAAVAIIKNTVKGMVVVIKSIITVVKDVVNMIGDLIHGRWGALWGDAKKLVVDSVKALIAFVSQQFSGLPGIILGVLGTVGSAAAKIGSALFNKLTGAIGDIGGFVVDKVRSAINGIIDVVNGFSLPSIHIPGAGTIGGGHPFNIGHVAYGGDIRGQRPYMVGERGPEVIFPGRDSYVMNNSILDKLSKGHSGGGNVTHITIQSLHPADANTLRQVATYVNRGQDMANSGRLYSPIQRPGL